jgi:hypothetical protein
MNTTKNPFRKPLIWLFVLFSLGMSAQTELLYADHIPDSALCMEISGKILKQAKNSGKAKIVLYHNNEPVDSLSLSGSKRFHFTLLKNEMYAIKIYKDGFLPRLISICTEMPLNKHGNHFYKFHFDTELIEASEYDSLNHDALDFPIALVSFNKKKKCFYYSEDYTIHIKKRIYNGETASK